VGHYGNDQQFLIRKKQKKNQKPSKIGQLDKSAQLEEKKQEKIEETARTCGREGRCVGLLPALTKQ